MFVQIHMLQSMPPGNLNRDETGHPKKCLFGGVTRGRISSQCLKRRIRLSPQFKEAFGDDLAAKTQDLPFMVADALRDGTLGVPEDELDELMASIAARFRKPQRGADSEDTEEDADGQADAKEGPKAGGDIGKTGQLVFFPPPFARRIAELIADFRRNNAPAYSHFLNRKTKAQKKEKEGWEAEIKQLVKTAAEASKLLTVDIGLFGRMTTSDLVVNVDACCQVAHAIGTHETLIESDYFTAMDDRADTAGAAFMGTGVTETFFNANVYYKYLNVDVGSLRDDKHLPSLSVQDAARVAGVLVKAAALGNPTGKQNSFAAHGVPEYILVEVSEAKRPISYANAFLQPVEGGIGRNLMNESAKAMNAYIDAVAAAFAPADTRRVLLAVGPAKATLQSPHTPVATLDELVNAVEALIVGLGKAGASA